MRALICTGCVCLLGGAQGQVECKLILFYNLAFCVLLSYLMGSDMRETPRCCWHLACILPRVPAISLRPGVLLVWTALWPVIRAIIGGIWVAFFQECQH